MSLLSGNRRARFGARGVGAEPITGPRRAGSDNECSSARGGGAG
jgi:hypothetical protein